MRQHVNPLSSFFQVERDLPAPRDLFVNPELPLHLDIGCARGFFLLAMAEAHPERNHLGLEIRHPLVRAAEAQQQREERSNVRFIFGNANVSLQRWLESLNRLRLELVTIQYPDPWFKKRHHKRRMVQPELLRWVAAAMPADGKLFLQSDVPEVIAQMLEAVEEAGCFTELDGGSWLADNPLAVGTERERYVLDQGLPVYRRLFGCAVPGESLHNPLAEQQNAG